MPVSVRILAADDRRVREALGALLAQGTELTIIGDREERAKARELALRLEPGGPPPLPQPGEEPGGLTAAQPQLGGVVILSMQGGCDYLLTLLDDSSQGKADDRAGAPVEARGMGAAGGPEPGAGWRPARAPIGPSSLAALPQAKSQLTQREREVLRLTAEGNSIKEISSLLNLSNKTVETYRRNLMEKPSVNNVAQLVRYAIRERLVKGP